MSKPILYDPCQGMPSSLPPALREALAYELGRAGTTYADAVRAAELPVTPEMVLELTRRWNSLTPEQVATWEQAAMRQNLAAMAWTRRN